MVRAANQSLRIERDIMLKHSGEKNVFYILFERIIISFPIFRWKSLLPLLVAFLT